MIKIAILGDKAVGKTSIVRSFVREDYNSEYKPTTGVCYSTRKLKLDNVMYEVQLWDCGELQVSDAPQFLRNCSGVILAYDVLNEQSLVNIKKYHEMVKQNIVQDDFPMILLGNKCDRIKQYNLSAAETTAKQLKLFTFGMCSARLDINIDSKIKNLIRKSLGLKIEDQDTENFTIEKPEEETVVIPEKKKCGAM